MYQNGRLQNENFSKQKEMIIHTSNPICSRILRVHIINEF